MEPSIHDNVLMSYSVLADKQEIVFHTSFQDAAEPEFTDLIFESVAGYSFDMDNFYTTIFSIEETEIESVYAEDRALFVQGRQYGWPGPWNRSDESFLDYVVQNNIKAFSVTSSSGMCGWVMAKSMKVVIAPT